MTGELLAHRITSEATADAKVFGVTWSDAGKLFLFDRGYSSASLWWRVHRVGGHFITRLPASYRPKVVSANRTHRGRARALVGRMLWEAVRGLRRKVIDVNCEFRVRVRRYRSSRGRWQRQTFRVVGIWNDDAKKYHFYVTDLPAARFGGESIAQLYRLRWEVETFYKTAKSGLGLDELPTTKPHIVRTLVRAALIRASLAMQAKCEADKHAQLGRWINPKLWTSVWNLALDPLLDKLLLGLRGKPILDWSFLAKMATDDYRNRPPTRWKLLNQSDGIESSLVTSAA